MASDDFLFQALQDAQTLLLANGYAQAGSDPNLYQKGTQNSYIRLPNDMSGLAHKIAIIGGSEQLNAVANLLSQNQESNLVSIL